ncbi:MAG: hypothetical protein IPP40_01800 [bacterium]|nr:hypothetical protein [bacterium]
MGHLVWSQTFGGSNSDACQSIEQTNDGGYVLVGQTLSFGAGDWDIWLVKISGSGDFLWSRTYGTIRDEIGYSVCQTSDGGFAVAGHYNAGDYQFYLVKTNSAGTQMWARSYGGAGYDVCVKQLQDAGFILGGITTSYGAGGSDVWIVRTNAIGDTLWTRTFGSTSTDDCQAIFVTESGEYLFAGTTYFVGSGQENFYMIRCDANGNEIWSKTFGGDTWEACNSVIRTLDGGFLLGGLTSSFGNGDVDFWVVKTNDFGDSLWSQTFGGLQGDWCSEVVQSVEGSYYVTGSTNSFGVGTDFWIVKTEIDPNHSYVLFPKVSSNSQFSPPTQSAGQAWVLMAACASN